MQRNPIFLIVKSTDCPTVAKLVSGSMAFSSRVKKLDKIINAWSIRRSGSLEADVNFLSSLISELNSWGVSPGDYKIEINPNQ